MCGARARCHGFSLIELSIGLVIVATLLLATLVPLATQMEQRRVSDTQSQLEMVRDALIGYAISHGRLPCPATASSNGREVFVDTLTLPSGALVPGGPNNGECLWINGFLPAATLGLSPSDSDGFFRDAYDTPSNRIRYAVSNQSVALYGQAVINCDSRPITEFLEESPRGVITRTYGIRSAGMAAVAQAADERCQYYDPEPPISTAPPPPSPPSPRFLRICTTAKCAGSDNQVLSNYGAVAVVWSVGRNAADAGRTIPADEQDNLDDESNDRDFVARERRDRREDAPDNEFDDIVLWISPNLLLSRMAANGALP